MINLYSLVALIFYIKLYNFSHTHQSSTLIDNVNIYLKESILKMYVVYIRIMLCMFLYNV